MALRSTFDVTAREVGDKMLAVMRSRKFLRDSGEPFDYKTGRTLLL